MQPTKKLAAIFQPRLSAIVVFIQMQFSHPNIANISTKHQSFDLKQQNHKTQYPNEPKNLEWEHAILENFATILCFGASANFNNYLKQESNLKFLLSSSSQYLIIHTRERKN